MSCFFNNGIGLLLLLFDSLRTAPQRLLIKLTTVCTLKLMGEIHSHISPVTAQQFATLRSYMVIKDFSDGST